MIPEDQTTFNLNKFKKEDTKEDVTKVKETVKKIRKLLYSNKVLCYEVIRPRKKTLRGVNKVYFYGVGLDLKINNICYSSEVIGLTKDYKFLYLVNEDNLKKFKVLDINNFSIEKVILNKYDF